MTVYFEVFSYAGTLTVTVISDPDHFPDPQNLTAALRDEFALVTSSPGITDANSSSTRSRSSRLPTRRRHVRRYVAC